MQLILEDYPAQEIEEIIRYCVQIGLPTSIKDMGYSDLNAVADKIAESTADDFFIGHMNNIDHSRGAIKGAVLTAVALSDKVKSCWLLAV